MKLHPLADAIALCLAGNPGHERLTAPCSRGFENLFFAELEKEPLPPGAVGAGVFTQTH